MRLTPLLFLIISAAYAQKQSETETDPARLFAVNCAVCHGADAHGARGPDLTSGVWRHGATSNEIARNIHDGIPGTDMPAFPLSGDQPRFIAEWLLSLSRGPESPIAGSGDNGRELFFGAAGCARCHSIAGAGGGFGPDLSHIGEQRSPSDLAHSIAEPGANPRSASKAAQVRLANGKVFRGSIVGEDTFSLYLWDRDENLKLLRKSEIRERENLRTLMPKPDLSASQLQDLVAFLKQPVGVRSDPSPWKPARDFNVSWDRLLHASAEPENWLHYWGNLEGTHYSPLKSVTPANVSRLAAQWTFQFGGSGIETTPIVVDGLMFVTGPRDSAAALDARTGFPIWRYRRTLPAFHANCTVSTNRGFAILGDRLYLGTLDAHLVALNVKTGRVVFDIEVEDYKKGFSITHAPLVVGDKIIVGVTAGECALYGFLDAYDAATGKRLWRVQSIAQPGDPARASWSGRSAETGGGPTWMTGTYDSETDTIFWGTGNPSPDYDGSVRQGDNLYTDCVLALDPATGRRKWYFQFTPHDTHDWDASETPVLIDAPFRGKTRKLLLHADRNGFYYLLDRDTGEFLTGKAFARQTWATGLDAKGRPIVIPNTDPTPDGVHICPDATGATNWASPSYDLTNKLLIIGARDSCAVFKSVVKEPAPGLPFTGTGDQPDESIGGRGSVTAIDPFTGDVRWKFPLRYGSASTGVLATGGGVLFAASKDGYLIGLDVRTGKLLWRYQTGTEIRSSPISYSVDGRQYIAISNDAALMAFALPN